MTTATDTMQSTASVVHQAKFIDVQGVRTRYYELGSGEPMLLIHGATFSGQGSANTWTLNLAGLAQKFHVFAPDRLGNGMTDNPKRDEDYSAEAVVQHLYDFTQAVGIKSMHVIGQSIGAYLATRLTLEHLDMVKSLVMIDTASLAPEVGSHAERMVKVNEGRPEGVKEYIRFYWERMSHYTDHVTDDYVDAGYLMESHPKALETKAKWEAGASQTWGQSQRTQKEETLAWIQEGRLQVPTLIFWAATDPSAILEQGIKLFDIVREKTPRTQMHIVSRGGHFHYREYPEEFNSVVTNFIEAS